MKSNINAYNGKSADKLQPITLNQTELSGEIGRRIDDLIYKNYMAIDIDHDFIEPFYARPFTDGFHYVGIGKVIDAGSLFAEYTDDSKVAERTSLLIDGIMKSRDADRYIGTFKPEPDRHQNHHNWVLHDQEYLILGLTRNWMVTGNEKSLQYACEIGDYVVDTFSKDDKPEEICTAGLPEAFITLYRCTGDDRYLNFAADIRHGNDTGEIKCASLRTWKQTFDTRPAHVYVMIARCYAQTELYRHDKELSLLEMSQFMRKELLRKGGGLNVAGSASDGEYFSYTQNGAGPIGEACVTAYLLRWLDSLMRLDGDLRYGDIMERTIYNALFAAQDPTGRKIRYFTPLTGKRDYFNQDGFCCPGNFRRIIAELPQKVYYRCSDNVIAVNMFTASKVKLSIGSDTYATITQETDYPNSGLVKFIVNMEQDSAFTMKLRIPRWCSNAVVAVNGKNHYAIPDGINVYDLNRVWKDGDTVTLNMPMTWRFVKGHQLQEGKVALMRGPVLFCLGTDQNAGIIEKYNDFHRIVIDPTTIGEPEIDSSIRPDGMKVTVGVMVEAAGEWSHGAPRETVTFTEFIDPSCIATYFHILNLDIATEDELTGDCFF
ncbi:MAG: beta-L-arabinofuranosidase domain-containing protein [bacterium]